MFKNILIITVLFFFCGCASLTDERPEPLEPNCTVIPTEVYRQVLVDNNTLRADKVRLSKQVDDYYFRVLCAERENRKLLVANIDLAAKLARLRGEIPAYFWKDARRLPASHLVIESGNGSGNTSQ